MKLLRHSILLACLLISVTQKSTEAYASDDDCGMVFCCPCLTVGAILYVVTWPVHTGIRKAYHFCQNRPQYKTRRVFEFALERKTGQKWESAFREFYQTFPENYWISEDHCKRFLLSLIQKRLIRFNTPHQGERLHWEDFPPLGTLIRNISMSKAYKPDYRYRNPPKLDLETTTATQLHQFIQETEDMDASPERDQFRTHALEALQELKNILKQRAYVKMNRDIGMDVDLFKDQESRIRLSDFDTIKTCLPGLADSVDVLEDVSFERPFCSICLEPFESGDKVLNCSGCAEEEEKSRIYHPLCFEKGLEIQAKDGHIPLSCGQCKKSLDFTHLDPETRKSWQQISGEHDWHFSRSRFRSKFPDISQCQGRECMAAAIPDEKNKDGYVSCQICSHKQCFQCGANHPGFSCEHWAKRQKGEEAFNQLVRDGHIRHCYHCNAPVAKIDGCNRIRCTSCGKDFHWDPKTNEASQWLGYRHHNANGTTW